MNIDLSIGEVEGLVTKACRGAGMSWGEAEDAGKAAGWLARNDLPGLSAFAGLLTEIDGKPFTERMPKGNDANTLHWRASAGALCSVAAGCAFSDFVNDARFQQKLVLDEVSYPLVFLGFVGIAAHRNSCCVNLEWQGVIALCGPDGVSLTASQEALAAVNAEQLAVKVSDQSSPEILRHKLMRGSCPKITYNKLSEFAYRIYVPATEQSRLSGAGAGLTDND